MRKVRLTKTFLEILACRDVYPVRDVAKHFSVSERRVKEIWRVRRETNTEPPNIRVKEISREILEDEVRVLLGRRMNARDIVDYMTENGKRREGINRYTVKEIIRKTISAEPHKYADYEIEPRRTYARRTKGESNVTAAYQT